MPQWTQACSYLSELVFLFSSDKSPGASLLDCTEGLLGLVFWGISILCPIRCMSNVFLYRPRSLTQLTPMPSLGLSQERSHFMGQPPWTAGHVTGTCSHFPTPHTRAFLPYPPVLSATWHNSYSFTRVCICYTWWIHASGVFGLHFAYCWSLSA